MKILFATDGSMHANHAARLLKRLHCSEPLSLTILTAVYSPANHDTLSAQTWFPQWRKEERDRIDGHHGELRELLRGIRGEVHEVQVDGHAPAHSILNEAETANVDLIVLGARGHSTIGRILLGSVSDTVATHAPCSVLVVRTDAEDATADEPIRMTLAYDRSSGSQRAVHDVKHFQWGSDASAHVLSIVPVTNFFGPEYLVGIEENYQEQADMARIQAEQLVGELSPMIPQVDAQVARGEHVGEAILLAAEENRSNLIVVGNSGHGMLSELILGSTSKYVLRHAPCSVWIARAPRTQVESTDPRSASAYAV